MAYLYASTRPHKCVVNFPQEGTAALYQMLKIGQPSKDQDLTPPGVATGMPETSANKSYGKQVSVQELFQGKGLVFVCFKSVESL